MFNLLKKLLKKVMGFLNYLMKYAMKHPLRMLVTAGVLYVCCSENILAQARDVLGMNQKIMEPSGNDQDQEKQQAPEMDDESMYNTSQHHTMAVAERDAKIEDMVNDAHL